MPVQLSMTTSVTSHEKASVDTGGVYQFQSSSSSASTLACDGVGDGLARLGTRAAGSVDLWVSSSSGSSSSKDTDVDAVTEDNGEGFKSGEGTADDAGDAKAASNDCETSERSRDARFCDLVNLTQSLIRL